MLVLTRRKGQQIVIDGQIVVTVLAVGKSSIRLGISGPPSIPIRRGELPRREELLCSLGAPAAAESPLAPAH